MLSCLRVWARTRAFCFDFRLAPPPPGEGGGGWRCWCNGEGVARYCPALGTEIARCAAIGSVQSYATQRHVSAYVRAYAGVGVHMHVLMYSAVATKLATSLHQFRHDQMEQSPTEPHAGRSTFLLSSGGVGNGCC